MRQKSGVFVRAPCRICAGQYPWAVRPGCTASRRFRGVSQSFVPKSVPKYRVQNVVPSRSHAKGRRSNSSLPEPWSSQHRGCRVTLKQWEVGPTQRCRRSRSRDRSASREDQLWRGARGPWVNHSLVGQAVMMVPLEHLPGVGRCKDCCGCRVSGALCGHDAGAICTNCIGK